MFPFLTVLGRTLPMYGLMLLLGALAAGGLCAYRSPRLGASREDAIFAALLAAAFGMVGAKVLYVLTVLPQIFSGGWNVLLHALSSGGFVFYGGVIGGLGAVYFYTRRYRIDFLRMLDLFAPGMALASAFGRVGCFSVGCCYGIPAPWGIAFKISPVALLHVPLIPVQLLESGFCLALCVVLLLYQCRARPVGRAAGLYLCLYAAARFGLEFIRGDAARGHIGPLSTSQWLGIAAFAGGIALMARAKQAKQKECTDHEPTGGYHPQ